MICAVIVAGGIGSRMNATVRKQYLSLDGVPIIGHTLKAFDSCSTIDRIVLVVPEDDVAYCRDQVLAPLSFGHNIDFVGGGRRRQDSVSNGLAAIDQADATVLIHDGVRPFVRPALISACLAGVERTGACIPAVPASDTLKQVDENGSIVETLDRRSVQLAQTPQTFSLDLIRRAHRLAEERGFTATDDASLAEFAGARVMVVAGDRDNIKITTPLDLDMAQTILRRWRRQNTP